MVRRSASLCNRANPRHFGQPTLPIVAALLANGATANRRSVRRQFRDALNALTRSTRRAHIPRRIIAPVRSRQLEPRQAPTPACMAGHARQRHRLSHAGFDPTYPSAGGRLVWFEGQIDDVTLSLALRSRGQCKSGFWGPSVDDAGVTRRRPASLKRRWRRERSFVRWRGDMVPRHTRNDLRPPRQALDQHRQLRSGHAHRSRARSRPIELADLEPFCRQNNS